MAKTFHSITLPGIEQARIPDFAAEFTEGTAYNVGDYCTYQGKLYVCIVRHIPGAWNFNYFEETNLDTELDKKLMTPLAGGGTPQNPRVGDLWVDDSENSPTIIMDTIPIENSMNPISSGGVKKALNSIHDQVDNIEFTYMKLPNEGSYGEEGQIPRSTGAGIEWVDPEAPTQDQINQWFQDHPEAWAIVQDHSLTLNKFEAGSLGYVTPEMYGARGDGVADDTQAIIDAINDMENLKVNLIVFKPNAIYSVTGVVTEHLKNLTIYGNNATLKLRKNSNTHEYDYILGVLSNSNALNLNDTQTDFINSNIKIYDLIIDGVAYDFENLNTSFYFNGIYLRNFENVIIKNCVIKNTFNNGIKLEFCDKTTINNCYFKDICLYNYPRQFYSGEGIVSEGYTLVGGDFNTPIYNTITSLNVFNCTFKNIYNSPAVARNCKYQSVTNCTMTDLHRTAFEPRIFTNDPNFEFTAIFNNNKIDNLNGSIIQITGNMETGTTGKVIVQNNTVLNVKGLIDTITQPDSVFGGEVSIYNNSNDNFDGTESYITANIVLNFENNYIQYKEEPVFPSQLSTHILVSGVRKVTFNNNVFSNILNIENSRFVSILSPNTEVEFCDNSLSGNYYPEILVYTHSNYLKCKNNELNFLSAPLQSSLIQGFIVSAFPYEFQPYYEYEGLLEVVGNHIYNTRWNYLMYMFDYPKTILVKDNYMLQNNITTLTYLFNNYYENPVLIPTSAIITGNIIGGLCSNNMVPITYYVQANNTFDN